MKNCTKCGQEFNEAYFLACKACRESSKVELTFDQWFSALADGFARTIGNLEALSNYCRGGN